MAAGFLALVIASAPEHAVAREKMATLAVFPVENLSGGPAPAEEIREFLIDNLTARRVQVLGVDDLDAFMARHRIRYAAGIDTTTAESLRKETGIDGVLIASIELSSDAVPPKFALVVRLVSIAATPTVIWADAAGLAGDDAPGFFELGILNEYPKLQKRALMRLTESLLAYLEREEVGEGPKTASKFRPKTTFRAVTLEPDRPYSIAVVPFFNLSDRRNAGEILALLFMRHLSALRQFRVIDTGVVRRQLLDARIIMDGGLSLSDADTIAALIDADFVLGGRVIRYADYEGPAGQVRVDFSTVLIEKASRKVVWSSDSYNEGSDGVRFFERGTSRTAHAMATQMVRLTTEMIAGRDR